jgi:hypothetical protein
MGGESESCIVRAYGIHGTPSRLDTFGWVCLIEHGMIWYLLPELHSPLSGQARRSGSHGVLDRVATHFLGYVRILDAL